jgi:hypothetical protein
MFLAIVNSDIEQMGEDRIRDALIPLINAFKNLSSDDLNLKTGATPEQLSEITDIGQWWSETMGTLEELLSELSEDDDESGGCDEAFEWLGSPTGNVDEVSATTYETAQGTNAALVDSNISKLPLTIEDVTTLRKDPKFEE